jgi:hypothetical protein
MNPPFETAAASAETPATRDTASGTAPDGNGSSGSSSLMRLLWPVGLSLAVLGVIAAFTFDPGEMGQMVANLDPWMILAAAVMVGVRILFGGWRLSHVSRGRLSLPAGLRGQLAWDFASNITPSLVGGAPLAAMYVSRDSKVSRTPTVPVGEVGAFVVFVMLLDQCWFAIMAPLVLVTAGFMEVIPSSLGSVGMITTVLYLVLFMMWTVVFGYGTLFRPELLQRLIDWIFRLRWLRRFRDRVSLEMAEYRERATIIRQQPLSFFTKGMVLTGGTWIARYLLAVFIIASVVPDLDLVLAGMRSIAMTLGSLVLPTPGGAGGIEGLYVLFFGSLMPKAYVVPTLLIWRLMAYYVFVAVGIVLSTHQVQKSIRFRRSHPAGKGDAASG